jgi:RNA polymerase sigma-70 factor (ECF subfamily)
MASESRLGAAAEPPTREQAAPADGLAGLVGRHQRAVFAYLRSLGCPDEHAEDLVQETFVAALDGKLERRDGAATRAWLRVVAKRRYLDHLRRRRGAPAVDLDAVDAAWRRYEGDDEGAAYLEALRQCLEGLAVRERRVVELRYRDGLDRARVAEELGLSLGGVKSMLARVKDALRACVERRLA